MFLKLHKFLTAFLLIYVLFLALKPCIDDCSINYCQTEGIEHIEDKHTDDHKDLCSPLCNCLCCNTIVSVSSDHIFVMNNTSTKMEVIDHPNVFPLSYKPTSPPPKA